MRDRERGRLKADLLAWYAQSRRDLPWRRTRDPYAIWLSEVMLQQTRVETVIPYYERFLADYPTIVALAEAPLSGVLRRWSGLGYYRRARMLHETAGQIVSERGGLFPRTAAGLRELRGVGRYTAGAVASIAWGEPVPVVDGNVARVLARLFAVDLDLRAPAGRERLWDLAGSLVATEDPSSWNQALMELGATTCVPKNPRCPGCPVRSSCAARRLDLMGAIPRPRVKKPVRVVEAVAFVLRRGPRVLLARREPSGLFGGMWEPPHFDAADPGVARALPSPGLRRVGRVTHVLSHRRIGLDVYAGKSTRVLAAVVADASHYDATSWVPSACLGDEALTSLARKVLWAAGVIGPAEGPRRRAARVPLRPSR